MSATDEVTAFIGHRVHLVRSREAPRLLRWLGPDLQGARVLDVAGGDGYWAGRLRRRGAHVVSLDIAHDKLVRGRRLRAAPALVEGDALRLPFRSASFDAAMSVCALEHFPDAGQALAEIARVLRPGGRLVMSVDAITRGDRYPALFAHHKERYHVHQTFRRDSLVAELEAIELITNRATYLFRGSSERLYLAGSRLRPNWSWNALVPLAPVTALVDHFHADDSGAILLVEAIKRGGAA